MQKKMIAIIVFCYGVLMGTSFIRPLVIRQIMDGGLLEKNFYIILEFAVVLLCISVLEEGVRILQAKLFVDLKNRVVLELYSKVFHKLMYAKMSYFSKNNASEVINRFSTDIDNASLLIDNNVMSVVSYVLQIISGVIGLVVVNWHLAILVLCIVPVKYILIFFFSKKKEHLMEKWIEKIAEFSAWFDDTINGVREIKLWGMYKAKNQEMRKFQKEVLILGKKTTLLETYNYSVDSLLQWMMVCILYGIGGYLVCKKRLSIGGLTAFISYSNYVIGPIALVFNLRFIWAQIKPSINRLDKFFAEETEREWNSPYDIKKFQKEIVFNKVSFSYSKQVLLKEINLTIHKGEKIAIVGENGSGKSTIINMLLRFLEPNEGVIAIDGIDIQKYSLKQYRELYAVVSQEIYLFKESLYNNVAMGRTIDKEVLNTMCQKLNLQTFLSKLSSGIETTLERNGENLSGGERQKVALLRAIIKDAPILILDEATSNMDSISEREILNYIKGIRDITLILISHRINVIADSDCIYVLQKGNIVARGTDKQLKEQCKLYRQLYGEEEK